MSCGFSATKLASSTSNTTRRIDSSATRAKSFSRSRLRIEFGLENLPAAWQEQYNNVQSRGSKRRIVHYVERKDSSPEASPPSGRSHGWREVYWVASSDTDGNKFPDGEVLRIAGYKEQPAMFPRWSAELEYGASPAMDALADMRELGQLILKKGVGLEKLIDPPMLVDDTLRNRPKSMMPGGRTYVTNLANIMGAKPAYTVNIPIAEMRADINGSRCRSADFPQRSL